MAGVETFWISPPFRRRQYWLVLPCFSPIPVWFSFQALAAAVSSAFPCPVDALGRVAVETSICPSISRTDRTQAGMTYTLELWVDTSRPKDIREVALSCNPCTLGYRDIQGSTLASPFQFCGKLALGNKSCSREGSRCEVSVEWFPGKIIINITILLVPPVRVSCMKI